MMVSENLSDAEQRDILALLLALALLWRTGDWVGRLYANWRIREPHCIRRVGANGAKGSRLGPGLGSGLGTGVPVRRVRSEPEYHIVLLLWFYRAAEPQSGILQRA